MRVMAPRNIVQRGLPFNTACIPETKSAALTVTVNAALPDTIFDGLSEVRTGDGDVERIANVRALEILPPGAA